MSNPGAVRDVNLLNRGARHPVARHPTTPSVDSMTSTVFVIHIAAISILSRAI